MLNDNSRYLDDLLIIESPEFEKHIPNVYPTEFHVNKTNSSDQESTLLDFNMKVIGIEVHTSVYYKRTNFGFPVVNFH